MLSKLAVEKLGYVVQLLKDEPEREGIHTVKWGGVTGVRQLAIGAGLPVLAQSINITGLMCQ